MAPTSLISCKTRIEWCFFLKQKRDKLWILILKAGNRIRKTENSQMQLMECSYAL